MKRLCVVLILCFAHSAWAQSFSETRPEDVGFIAERLDRIDSTIVRSINNGEIPGAVALIARNGKIAYHKSFGYADVASKTKMDKNSIFRIASMTKAITSVGVMVLYERGHFMLNDPVSKYLPEFKSPKILVEVDTLGNVVKTEPSKKEIRIIDLLTHTSGISYPFIESDLQKVYKKAGIIDGSTSREVRLRDQMTKIAALPLLFEPGSKFQYGLNTDILGYLCQVVSGKSFDRFLSDEIFVPLGMVDSYFYIPDSKKHRLVTLYAWVDKEGLVVSKGDESIVLQEKDLKKS